MPTITFLGITVEAPTEEAAKSLAVTSWLQQFNEIDFDTETVSIDLETVRAAAIEAVTNEAKAEESQLDALLSGNFVRAIMLNTEIVDYVVHEGRPASPSAARYKLAAALSARRGDTLRDTLESLFAKWRDVQDRITIIITELDRLTEALESATTIEQIETALASMDWT